MKYLDFDNRDTCLQVSHYCWATQEVFKAKSSAWVLMLLECNLVYILGHRKNRTYKWSNSEGLTKWLYDKVLRHIGLDPYKGLNGDQYRALFLCLYKNRQKKAHKKLAVNVLLGFIFRLGFTPSLMEHAFLKPQAYVLLFKVFNFYYLNPLYWISLVAFFISMKLNLKQPIKGNTTNKITLLPTMKILGFKMPSKEYIEAVYQRYYGEDTPLSDIMYNAVTKRA